MSDIELDDSGPRIRVRFTLPQEWFTLSELRSFAAYLTLIADENKRTEDTTMIDPTRVSRATIQASQEYGTCVVCGNAQRLTARGNLYQHQTRDRLGYATGEQCPGAGEPPQEGRPGLRSRLRSDS